MTITSKASSLAFLALLTVGATSSCASADGGDESTDGTVNVDIPSAGGIIQPAIELTSPASPAKNISCAETTNGRWCFSGTGSRNLPVYVGGTTGLDRTNTVARWNFNGGNSTIQHPMITWVFPPMGSFGPPLSVDVHWVGANQDIPWQSIVLESSNVPGGSALCLDVQWGSAANGTPVWLWPCTGSVAQQWSYNSSTRQLTAMGKCLEFAAPVVQGSQLQIWDCNGSFQQRWSVVPYEDGTWGFSPVAFANFVGFRMDLVKNVAVAQQPLWAWPTNSSSAQKFRFYTR